MSNELRLDTSPNTEPVIEPLRIATTYEMASRHLDLVQAATEGIDDVTGLTTRPRNYDTSLMGQGEALSDIENYFLNNRGQLQIEPFLNTIIQAGFCSPDKPAFLITDKDLIANGTNFVFGITSKPHGVSLQSVYRFINGVKSEAVLRDTFRHVARHEYGHLLGLDETTIQNQDKRGGVYLGHCLKDCTMQQVMSVPEAVTAVQARKGQSQAGFCDDCVSYLATC